MILENISYKFKRSGSIDKPISLKETLPVKTSN